MRVHRPRHGPNATCGSGTRLCGAPATASVASVPTARPVDAAVSHGPDKPALAAGPRRHADRLATGMGDAFDLCDRRRRSAWIDPIRFDPAAWGEACRTTSIRAGHRLALPPSIGARDGSWEAPLSIGSTCLRWLALPFWPSSLHGDRRCGHAELHADLLSGATT